MKKLLCTILIMLSCIGVSAQKKSCLENNNHFGLLFAGDCKEHYGFSLVGNADYFSVGLDFKFSERHDHLIDLNVGVALFDYLYVMGTVGYNIVPNITSHIDQIDYGCKAVCRIPVVPFAVTLGWTRYGQLTYGIGIFFNL